MPDRVEDIQNEQAASLLGSNDRVARFFIPPTVWPELPA